MHPIQVRTSVYARENGKYSSTPHMGISSDPIKHGYVHTTGLVSQKKNDKEWSLSFKFKLSGVIACIEEYLQNYSCQKTSGLTRQYTHTGLYMSNGPKRWSCANFVTIFGDLHQIKRWGICNNFNQITHLSSASCPSNDVIKMAAIVQI